MIPYLRPRAQREYKLEVYAVIHYNKKTKKIPAGVNQEGKVCADEEKETKKIF